jgi:hypothetical protein
MTGPTRKCSEHAARASLLHLLYTSEDLAGLVQGEGGEAGKGVERQRDGGERREGWEKGAC